MQPRTKGISHWLWKHTTHFLCIINRDPHSLLRKGVKKKNNIIKSKHPELPWSCRLWSFAQTHAHGPDRVHTRACVASCARTPTRRRRWHPTEGYQRSSWHSPGLCECVAPSTVFKTHCPGAPAARSCHSKPQGRGFATGGMMMSLVYTPYRGAMLQRKGFKSGQMRVWLNLRVVKTILLYLNFQCHSSLP